MATLEMELDLSKRDFLTLGFARRKSRGGQPPRRSHFRPPSPQPQPPDWERLVTRREVIIAAGTIVAGGAIAALLKPWDWFKPQPEQAGPETLESLVAQAKKMEDEYKGKDLSDKTARERYADTLVGIFAFHYPGYFSRQQLKKTLSWVDTLDQFVRQKIASSGRSGEPSASQLENERFTTASTDNRRRKITVNVASEAFKNAPLTWNPLKILRISLLHEFNHLVFEGRDEIIFSIIDPNNRIEDKRVEGFRFVGVDEKGKFATALDDLHEAVIELLAKDISQSDFGLHISNMPSQLTGEDITAVMNRLEQILQIVGITHQELAILHKNSNLREFLLKISDKAGVSLDASLENRIRFGSIIAGAIERNDQRTLQSYINQVRSIAPTKSQK